MATTGSPLDEAPRADDGQRQNAPYAVLSTQSIDLRSRMDRTDLHPIAAVRRTQAKSLLPIPIATPLTAATNPSHIKSFDAFANTD